VKFCETQVFIICDKSTPAIISVAQICGNITEQFDIFRQYI